MISSTESAPAQRTPAWAKFLKLKQQQQQQQPGAAAAPNGSVVGHQPSRNGVSAGALPSTKRGPPSADASPPKRTRREAPHDGRNVSANKPTKTVTFGDTPTKRSVLSSAASSNGKQAKHTTTTNTGTASRPQPLQQPKKKPKGPPKKQKPQPAADLGSALAYLRQWQSARDTWKFNKNHQTTLIRHFFDADAIPAADTKTFYAYINDLKGFVRTRLRETAMEIQAQDAADGPAAFPEGTAHREDKQATYENVITELLRRGHEQQQAKRKIVFDEPEYITESQDVDAIIRRVVKRMRAELVLHELSDSGESTDKTSNTAASSQTVVASDEDDEDDDDDDDDSDDNAAQAPASKAISGRRRRKLRTNMDDSSSSDSESESDSDSSSSSSSEDSDDDDDDTEGPPEEGYDTSSSSSSSSSGEEEDDEDSDDEDTD